ncbi:MAG: Tn3 family transposase [Alphaproteobacteria bacterium]
MKVAVITEDQLAKDWTLSEKDIQFVLSSARTEIHQIRCAIYFCILRKTGRFATERFELSLKAINYLADQLMQESLLQIPNLDYSKADYVRFVKIQEYLNYKDFGDVEKQNLNDWCLQQTQYYPLNNQELVVKAKEYLLSKRILLPSPSSLGRFIAKAVKNSHFGLFEQIVNCYPNHELSQLDNLLTSSDNSVYTELMAFKRPPPEPSATVINKFLSYFEILEKLKIPECDLSKISPKVIETISQQAKNQSSWGIRRIKPDQKRYAILICFLAESTKTILDTIIDMHSLLLGDIERKSKNEFKLQRITMIGNAKTSREKTLEFTKKALSCESPETMTLADFLVTFNRDELHNAVKTAEEYEEFEERGIVRNMTKRFSYMRKYSKKMLKLNFEAATGNKPLMEAINILRNHHENGEKNFPTDPPISFLPKAWRDNLYDDQGKFQIKYFEMGVYYAMRQNLNKGDLYLTDSRHHRYFWDNIYNPVDWQDQREESYSDLDLPTEFDQVQVKLTKELEENVKRVHDNLEKDGFATIIEGKLKLCREDALEIPPEVKHLRRQIESAMPTIRIEKLLAEVDKITNFSAAFLPNQKERPLPKKPLYAAITAQATNIGIYAMGQSNQGITAETINGFSERYITEENIQNGNAILIKHTQAYPLTQVYGGGNYSSSDGQRFGIQSSTPLSAYYPRYYGFYDKAISIYTHVSDQYSVFHTSVISCAVREATYVLDGLLLNKTVLNPEFHCTDSHGYTDHLFALCYLLGYSFQPRLSGLPHHVLYKMDKNNQYGKIDCLFNGSANLEIAKEQWDIIVRVAASLRNSIAPAHVIIQRLAGRGDKVAKALQALGRVVKTIYILRYISDPGLRRKVHLQLNRGESRHSLAKTIFFDNRGVFKTSDYEEIMNKASCLSFVSNAVLVWKTHQTQQILDRLRREGYKVDDALLAKISLLSSKNIIFHGTYNFEEIS